LKAAVTIVLAAGIAFASAVELVVYRHESRKLFVILQDLRETKQNLNREWGQLLLEQATWGTQIRVEKIASEKLGMIVPRMQQIVELP
jgi:cell division protein FtsL